LETGKIQANAPQRRNIQKIYTKALTSHQILGIFLLTTHRLGG
jgi:hypothetical protein